MNLQEKTLKCVKLEKKCLKKPENQQNGAQKTLNSGLYQKILMPVSHIPYDNSNATINFSK